ncbi:hypothetical protein BD414DRAFT_431783 [Trametes punicea]|nr:hypothetical protein BD414DRAFT_431783 [Trametes punicea]
MALAGPDATANPALSDLESLQQELAGLMSGLGHAHEKLAEVVFAADQRNGELRSKIAELERQNLMRVFRIRDLELENAELRKQAETPHPDLEIAIQERDRASRNLKKAQKVIEGLLKTIEELQASSDDCTCSARKRDQTPEARSRTQVHQESYADPEDDGSTIRPQRFAASTGSAATPPVTPRPRADRAGKGKAKELEPSHETMWSGSASSQSTWDTPSSASRALAKEKRLWYLEFMKPPSTAELQHGPIPFDFLAEQLELEEDVQFAIINLEAMPGYDTRIHAESLVAFAYEPIILEGPGPMTTYFIGWTRPDEVPLVEYWTKRSGDLHLFIWPVGETVGWRYIGLHSLSFVEMESKWPMLQAADKHRLLTHLRDRNPGMDSAEFRRDVREGRLAQVCIQLESKGRVESHDFLREYGLLAGD